ncbi:mucin-13b [Limanda limanda]|uniref:mucin-13b n=1 Tax=Limanda limanda TaxID=27771 RepID=UPI0029C9619B|nr:mucin-13b [Limanda limanda]
MAGKYNLFLVLWFVVACLVKDIPTKRSNNNYRCCNFDACNSANNNYRCCNFNACSRSNNNYRCCNFNACNSANNNYRCCNFNACSRSNNNYRCCNFNACNSDNNNCWCCKSNDWNRDSTNCNSTRFNVSSSNNSTRFDPCQPNPCGRGSTCAVRFNQTFVCLCLPGDHYNDGSKVCVKAKVFPGQLSLPKLTYNEKMENKQSPEFKEAAQNITTTLTPLYNITDGFSDVTVLSLQKLAQSRVGSVRMEGVTASIEIIFSESSTITTSEVTSVMEEAAANCSNCLLGGATFNETDNCAAKPCDEVTTTCSSGNGTFVCSCKETYINTTFSDRLCIACPSGQEAVNSSSCKPCKPGFSGLNCLEDWKQTLIIVGSVLGGLLLITLILLIILAVRSSKKSSKKSKHEDIGKPYVSHFTAKAPLANGNGSYANSQIPSYHGSGYEGAGVPKIPRATANNNWERRSNMEMTPSNSRQNLVPMGSNSRLYDDDDDMNSYTRPESNHYASAPARPQSNLYAQSRPQSNPYAQSRPQSNPYAAKQGQNNPYYQ